MSLRVVQQAIQSARGGSDFVLPLYRLEGIHEGGEGGGGGLDSRYPGAIKFLSRRLLLLGSFVIFCSLLFWPLPPPPLTVEYTTNGVGEILAIYGPSVIGRENYATIIYSYAHYSYIILSSVYTGCGFILFHGRLIYRSTRD
jgi:hypothetical protein